MCITTAGCYTTHMKLAIHCVYIHVNLPWSHVRMLTTLRICTIHTGAIKTGCLKTPVLKSRFCSLHKPRVVTTPSSDSAVSSEDGIAVAQFITGKRSVRSGTYYQVNSVSQRICRYVQLHCILQTCL